MDEPAPQPPLQNDDVRLLQDTARQAAGEERGGQPPASKSAQRKMANEIQSGRTPYNYSAEEGFEDRPASGGAKGGSSFSLGNVFALIAIGVVSLGGYVMYVMVDGLSQSMDNLNRNVDTLAAAVAQQGRQGRRTSEAIIRAEFMQARAALEGVAAIGDPRVSHKAREMVAQIDLALDAITPRKQGNDEIGDLIEPLEQPQPADAPPAAQDEPAAAPPAAGGANGGQDKAPAQSVAQPAAKQAPAAPPSPPAASPR